MNVLGLSRTVFVFFFQAEDGIRDGHVTGVQTCALPICGLPVGDHQQHRLHPGVPTEELPGQHQAVVEVGADRKSTRLNSSHVAISYAVFCLKKKKKSSYLRTAYLAIMPT